MNQINSINQFIDITLAMDDHIPVWPGSEGIQLRNSMSLEAGDAANVTVICCDVHFGTHIDAPRHFISSGKTVDDFLIQTFMGPAYVVNFPNLKHIDVCDLEKASIPSDATRLLVRTDNSKLLKNHYFDYSYTYLTPEAASWVATHGFNLLGFDYLSIEQYGAAPLAHLALMQAGVVILEGINLFDVDCGWYELICLPIRLVGKEGAPVRAVLKALGRNT